MKAIENIITYVKSYQQKEFLFVTMFQLPITLHDNRIREIKYSLKEKVHYAINVSRLHGEALLFLLKK